MLLSGRNAIAQGVSKPSAIIVSAGVSFVGCELAEESGDFVEVKSLKRGVLELSGTIPYKVGYK
jgi:hypothetical protein